MADTIQVTYKVMEDGSLKAIGRDAEKAAKGTDKATKSADKYSKKNKGVAQATSNSTKAFSKMTTGIQGGLVPAYATLAANVFALTAVFGTLSRIDAVAKLEQGLEFVGRASGRNLKLVADGLKEITGNAVSAEQAMRTTAVGISAGFSEDQMKGLAQVAKGASLALGRDMADAMDRLTRGAAKLEPEILDELGIMVRLDDAVDKYAQRHNKAASELTQFERRQAFTNAILEDGKKKFQDITDAIDPSAYSKLAAAFQDLTKTVIGGLNTALNPLIDFFSGAPAALAGVAAVFGGGMVSQLIGGLQGIATGAAEAAERTEEHAKAALKGIKPHEKMGKAFNEVARSSDRGKDALNRMLKSVNMSINMTSKDTAKLKIATKARQALTKEIFRLELAETKHRLASTLGTLQTFGAAEAFRHLGRELSVLRTQTLAAASGQTFLNRMFIMGSGIATGFAASIRLVGAAFLSFLPYIGLAVTAFTLLMPYFKKPESNLDKVLKKNQERLAEFSNVVDQYVESIKKTEDPNARFLTTLKTMAGLQTEAQAGIQDVLNATDASANRDYFIQEAEVKAHQSRVNGLLAKEKEFDDYIAKRKAERRNTIRGTVGGSVRSIMDDAIKKFGDFRVFGDAKNALRDAQDELEDAQDTLGDMEKIDPKIIFANEGAAGVRAVAIEFNASLRSMQAELKRQELAGKDVTDAQATLARAIEKANQASTAFNENPTRENAIKLSEAFRVTAEESNAAVDSVKTYDDTLSALKKNLDVQTGTLGKYGKTLDLVDAAINRVNSVEKSKGQGQAAIMAEEVNDLLENYTHMTMITRKSPPTFETEQEALKRYRASLNALNNSIIAAGKEQERLRNLEAAGMGDSTQFAIDKLELQDQMLENLRKEIELTPGLEERNKLEEEYNEKLRERLKLQSDKTKKLVDDAKDSGMGAATVGVLKGIGAKENLQALADADQALIKEKAKKEAGLARRAAEQKAAALEADGDLVGAQTARTEGGALAGSILKKADEDVAANQEAADENKGIAAAQAARESMKGIADDLRAISPENAELAATIDGFSNMSSSFQVAMETMKSDSASMTDKVTAGLGALASTISAIGAVQKAASEQRVRAIDEEIKAEQNRDGKSAASQAKIAALEKKKEAEKRKQFEKDKKMKIAQTIIGGLQGAISAYTSLSIIPIVGPALGAVAAAAILSMTADNVAAIKATQYSGGGGVGGVSKISAGGGRSNTVDLATANNAGGEQAYMRGAEGQGKMGNFKPAFAGYKHRQAGGYVVGEQGPELFMPEESGEIIPAGQQVGSATNVNFTINAVDTAGVQELLEVQKGNIISMIRQAAHDHGEDFLELVKEDSL